MQDRPESTDILAAVEAFLEKEVIPQMRGRRQFLARVAANALRTVVRELEAPDRSAEEAQRACALLGGEREDWRAALAESIRTGDFDADERLEPLLRFLRDEVQGKLAVSNPALLAADRARGID